MKGWAFKPFTPFTLAGMGRQKGDNRKNGCWRTKKQQQKGEGRGDVREMSGGLFVKFCGVGVNA